MKKGMILLLTFLFLSLSVTACELHIRKGELISVMLSGTNSEKINKVEDVDDKFQGKYEAKHVQSCPLYRRWSNGRLLGHSEAREVLWQKVYFQIGSGLSHSGLYQLL